MIVEHSATSVARQALCSHEKLHTYVDNVGIREERGVVCIESDRSHKKGRN